MLGELGIGWEDVIFLLVFSIFSNSFSFKYSIRQEVVCSESAVMTCTG